MHRGRIHGTGSVVRVGRRELLAGSAAFGLAASSGALLTKRAKAEEPKKGGSLRIGIGGASSTDTLDPALVTDVMAPVVTVGQLRNCLVEVDANSELVGELAESWEPAPDAATWRFKIRRGVEFHDGKPLDVDDVIFSIDHHRKEESQSVVNSLVAQIRELRADGDVLIVTLEAGNANFPFVMSDPHLQIVPAGTTDFSKGIGTGGYMLVDWDPGVRAFTTRNPNYWKPGRAHFDEVETLAINDVSARTSAVLSGEVDVMNRCDRKTASRLEQAPGIALVIQDGFKHYSIPMRTDTAPFDDNNVRLAFKHAIDRDAVVKTILQGYGVVGNDHPISQANRYYASELEQREYDPEKAKFHLREAGLESLTVSLHAADVAFDGAVDTALLFREHAAKAGITIDVVREPDDGYWSSVWMNKPWCMSYWSGRPTEDWIFTETYAAGANWNETFWDHERFNQLLKEGRAELDEARRREIYIEMQETCRDEGGAVIPAFASDLHAATDRLGHDKPAVNWEFDGYRVAERWWFS